MSAGVQQRWIVLGADGRHMSLGRATRAQRRRKCIAASDALAAQGLSGWLARMQGEYYSRGKIASNPSSASALRMTPTGKPPLPHFTPRGSRATH
jgi:hypothetical protein